jgi:hypothetical protein
MRSKILAAIAALPLATTAQAANVYAACVYQTPTGKLAVTQLFTLKGDALRDGYGAYTYEKVLEWEKLFPMPGDTAQPIGGFYADSFVGQFHKFAEANGDSHANCHVATTKERFAAWYGAFQRDPRLDATSIQSWRPVKADVVAVEDWSGRPVEGAAPKADPQSAPRSDAKDEAPPRRSEEEGSATGSRKKMTNAEADAKYEADMAEYNKKLAEQRKQVDEFNRAQDELARKKQEQKLAADRAAADYQVQLAAHEQTVRNQQLEYQKQVARPAEAPNAVYRGFWARDCAAARLSATQGAGTSSTTRFKEVAAENGNGGCTVQGWWWNVAGGGTATRQ